MPQASDGPQQSFDHNDTYSQESTPRVLSIQSHVVHGYVGNKCAVFPLQLHGFDVDSILSVQFSNHTGYPSFQGPVLQAQELHNIINGLQDNGLLNQQYLLTGYIGSVEVLAAIAEVHAKLNSNNDDFMYVCDPVMGDCGKLYVAADMVGVMRQRLVPLASVLTPNAFEAELLTGVTITTLSDAFAACEALHDIGPHTVVITSMAAPQQGDDEIWVIASTRLPQAAGYPRRMRMRIPRIHAYFTGTGDLVSALLLAWLHRHRDRMLTAVERTINATQHVLRRTAAACEPSLLSQSQRSREACAARELRLVQCREQLLDPPVIIHPEPIHG